MRALARAVRVPDVNAAQRPTAVIPMHRLDTTLLLLPPRRHSVQTTRRKRTKEPLTMKDSNRSVGLPRRSGSVAAAGEFQSNRGMPGQSLYERIGGEGAVAAAVDLFYEKVLADDLTRPFFEGLDMAAQVRKQMAFMTVAFGGPNEYRGRDLRTAHARLAKEKGLSDVHFDAVAGHLKATLLELKVPGELVDEVIAVVAGTRDQVLGR